MEIEAANERYHLGIEGDEYRTIGGYVFGKLGRLPHVGDGVAAGAKVLQVEKMNGRRVERVRVLDSVTNP